MKKIFEWLLNAVMLLAAIVALVALAPYAKSTLFPARDALHSVLKGDTFSLPNLSTSKSTLILGIRPGCHWCEQEIPLYQKLGSLPLVTAGVVDVVALFPPKTDETAATEWLHKNNIPGRMVIAPDSETYKITGTPTLVLVSGRHTVTRVWAGAIPADKEVGFLSAVR